MPIYGGFPFIWGTSHTKPDLTMLNGPNSNTTNLLLKMQIKICSYDNIYLFYCNLLRLFSVSIKTVGVEPFHIPAQFD